MDELDRNPSRPNVLPKWAVLVMIIFAIVVLVQSAVVASIVLSSQNEYTARLDTFKVTAQADSVNNVTSDWFYGEISAPYGAAISVSWILGIDGPPVKGGLISVAILEGFYRYPTPPTGATQICEWGFSSSGSCTFIANGQNYSAVVLNATGMPGRWTLQPIFSGQFTYFERIGGI